MRILASTTAGTGHFMPMVPILSACKQAGHDVLVACPDSFAATVADEGFTPAPFDDAPREEWGAVMSGLPGLPADEANRIVVAEAFDRIDTTAVLPRLASAMEGWRPDLVLRDPSEFASWLLAARLGLPRVRVSISLLSLDRRFADAAAGALRGLPAAQGLSVDAAALTCGGVLAAAPAAFDPPPGDVDVSVHRYAEPLLRTPGRPDAMPGGDEPLVYVTFGTVAASVGAWPAIYRAVLDGLADAPVRMLMTTGEGVDPADLGPLPDSVSVAAFVPQAAVLRHADVMVTHAGFGTVLGGLRAGVPMVVAPLFADQSYNASRAVAAGVGVSVATSLDPGVVPPGLPQEVRSAVLRLLEDPVPRAASRGLADEMAHHIPVAAVIPTLEAIAERHA